MSICEHCGRRFDPAETRGTYNGSTARFVCPSCGCSTSGPLPT
jgi:transposase-like protein